MILAIPLQKQHDYTELRYCLRSIEKFMDNPEIVIIGEDLPEWITNITQIIVADLRSQKQLSIKTKIIAALEYTDQIFFTNDDIFLLKYTDPVSYPYYYMRQLRPSGESGTKILLDTLKSYNLPTKHFDVHYPILYKKDFKDIAEKFPGETIIKSMYCNYLQIEGTEMQDCKIMKDQSPVMIKTWIKDKPCFSTGVHSIKSALRVLQELFPYKSKYEV